MSVAYAEPVLDRPRTGAPAAAPSPARERDRPRRTGPGVGPVARPRRLRFVAPAPNGPRACAPAPAVLPAAAPTRVRSSWRLTERGVAVVLVVAAALVAASVVVVGLTALRVTGDGYRLSHAASTAVVADR